MTQKNLERILILRTLMLYGPMTGAQMADRASTECDHDLLETLPPISRRVGGTKLNAMALLGLVTCDDSHPARWTATAKGRELAESIGPVATGQQSADTTTPDPSGA